MTAVALPRSDEALLDVLARPSREGLVSLRLPAPVVEAEAFVRAVGASNAFVFAPPDGPELAACGGPLATPLASIAEARAAFDACEIDARVLGSERSAALRVFVASPFPDPRVRQGLMGGMALLPRWTYEREGPAATATLLAPAAECTGAGARRIVREWRQIVRALGRACPSRAVPRGAVAGGTTRAEHRALVDAACLAIASGSLAKVVVSRLVEWHVPEEGDALALLRRLAGESGWGARVAVQHDGESFVAVTPERLIRRLGRSVESDALAGTVDAALGDENSLRASIKDDEEHATVVREVASVFRRFCGQVDIQPRPGIRALRQVVHLHTPVRGWLQGDTHVLELASALHPTPAVAGYPREPALAWIRAHESMPRGLYAGLIGWFDARGDGDLWVALRGARLAGRMLEQRVGGGIIQGSRANDEWLETEAKRRALARALGALA